MLNPIGNPLPIGSPIPAIPVLNSFQGQKVTVDDIKRKNGVVLAFIHGTWCPYCIHQLTRLNGIVPSMEDRQVGLMCISHDPETVITAYQLSASPQLRYLLVEDTEPSLAHSFGIFDNDPDHMSPYPAVFYVDSEDMIRYYDISSDPDCHPSLEKLIEYIDSQLQ